MSGPGTLIEYLCLTLDTVCGHWMRAGERVRNAPVLRPERRVRRPGIAPFTRTLRRQDARSWPDAKHAAGLPTAAAADEILLQGDGQLRALISTSGNPAAAWPNQAKVVRALTKLELLVQIDPWMSQTAQLADYVIAPTMPLETPGTSQFIDFTSGHAAGFGIAESYGRYTPTVIDRPSGSDLIEEWEFFYGLAQRLGLDLRPHPPWLSSIAAGLLPSRSSLTWCKSQRRMNCWNGWARARA